MTGKKLTRSTILRIMYTITIVPLCYYGAFVALYDITKSESVAKLLAFLSCLDFGLTIIAARFDPKEPSDVWYLFGAIFLIAAFCSTLVWWALGIQGIDNRFAVFGAGVALALRVIAINCIHKIFDP